MIKTTKLSSELTTDQIRRINKFYMSYTVNDLKEGAMEELAKKFNITKIELYKVIEL
jgi:hypothetical protein